MAYMSGRARARLATGKRLVQAERLRQRSSVALFALLLLLSIGVGSSLAEETGAGSQGLPSAEQVIEAIEGGPGSVQPVQTDPGAAEGLPREDLGRSEALALLQGVFEAQLEMPTAVFEDLEVQKFLSANVAVVPSDEPPMQTQETDPSPSPEGGEDSAPREAISLKDQLRAQGLSSAAQSASSELPAENRQGGYVAGTALLDSTLPLRSEGPSGKQEPVDLSLEHAEGELRPANPLVDVDIPADLGEGIELPGPDVTIRLQGAPQDRSPSVANESVAFLPNVATDTDLALVPTPTGVETFTQLRSEDSPLSQTFELELPAGAVLKATDDGGALVARDEEALVGISSPSAIDATGAEVPVSLDISGNTFALVVSPDPSAEFPILVDPLIQTYDWISTNQTTGLNGTSQEEWSPNWPAGSSTAFSNIRLESRDYSVWTPVPYGAAGLVIRSKENLTAGDYGSWAYTVPRYYTDQTKYGTRPTSFLSQMTLWNLDWNAHSYSLSPYIFAGIWDPFKPGWVSYYSHEGLAGHDVGDMAWKYQFPNPNSNTNAKIGYLSVQATQTGPNQNTEAYVGSASVQLNDSDVPGFGSISGPSSWLNQSAAPINFSVSDSGLGVHSLTATVDGVQGASWKTSLGCVGVAGAPCPRTWASSEAGRPPVKYESASLPTGINYLKVIAEDPVGNKSAPAYAQVKVDHTAPQISLAGTMTEQASLGIKRPSYTLRVDASDGTALQPQSGAAKTVIKVDGVVVQEAAPGCGTQSCGISREWTLDASKYAPGAHSVAVTATDGVGLSTTKTLNINLDPSPPSVALSGTLTEQATLGTSRPRYKLKVDASTDAGLEGSLTRPPTFASSLGAAGTANGQFQAPAGVAVDSKDNLWVVDSGSDRVQKFNAAGQYVSSFGSPGTGSGQFGRPSGIAIDAKGNIWVADADNHRIQKFNEAGQYLSQFGSYGAGNGQLRYPEGIAIDPKGNVWVADTYNGRLQKFNEAGQFVKVISSYGTGPGQLAEPADLDFGPGGNVWVADWVTNRVSVFDEEGQFVRQFGTEGAGKGQFWGSAAIDVDTVGNVWVVDQGNQRVQQFNQSGEYLAQFGSAGTGVGQFRFTWPAGITSDARGNLWISDSYNNRVQKWKIPDFAPDYVGAFGSTGAGQGQFSAPSDAAVDLEGNLWVLDRGNNRVQKFNLKGEYLSQFGSYGTANGQFKGPSGIAVDAEGNLLITDSGNHRVQKFNVKGEYLSKFGSFGTGTVQFNEPTGIAVAPSSLIFITDKGNHRIHRVTKTGTYFGQAGSYGWEDTQFIEPSGVAIGPPMGGFAYTVLVADSGNDRIQRFGPDGQFIGKFGSPGSAAGQLTKPAAVDVDAMGNVWVGDRANNRLQKFSQSGEYITQFGSTGAGQGQLNLASPMGIASDPKGNLWVTDTSNNRVQRWSQGDWRSEIKTEIAVDGKWTNVAESGCTSDQCALTREWTLNSPTYTAGPHTVLVKATDGLGNTSSKTLPVNIQRDTTKPTLQAGGQLIQAPEGWVEQDTYGINATATDAGHGVTSLAFRIDGTQVASATQSCPDGACSQSLTKSLDMNAYDGGAHNAEIVATDGAGNTTAENWTINVDPEGHVTAGEAEDTLDAADATSQSTVVASTSDVYSSQERADGNNPSLVEGADGGELESRGTSNLSTISVQPEGGFTIDLPESTLHAEPATINAESTSMTVTEAAAAVAGNTRHNVDTVIRPMFNGVTTFQSIRDASAPETYSWEVALSDEQTLRSVDPLDAEIVFEDGSRAMLITAEPAHDAVGASVPTSLSVSQENIITLTVSHRQASVVYPVVAGSGWEGGYTTQIVIGPKDAQEQKEEYERIAREKQEQVDREAEEEMAEGVDEPAVEWDDSKATGGYGPRRMFIAVGAPEMWDYEQRVRRSKFQASYCANLTCDYWHTWEWGTWFWNGVRGKVGGYAWRGNTAAKCATEADHPLTDTELHSVGWSGPNPAPYGYGQYLNFWCNFRFEWWNLEGPEKDYYQIQDHLYGSGYEGAHIKDLPPPIILN